MKKLWILIGRPCKVGFTLSEHILYSILYKL